MQQQLTHTAVAERARGESLVLETSDGPITITLSYSTNARAVHTITHPINVTLQRRQRLPHKGTAIDETV